MARPVKSTVDYFPHDANASEGRTLSILENHFGHEGYAAWFKLLERVSVTNNQVIDIRNPEDVEFLAAKMRMSAERLKIILSKMADLGAIDKPLFESGYIWCQNLVDRLDQVYRKRKQEPPTKPELSTPETGLSTPETELIAPETPQSKVNKSKVNKSKGQEHKKTHGQFQNVTLTDEEKVKLESRYGVQGAICWIEELSLAKASKGYKSISDYATILSWERRRQQQGQASIKGSGSLPTQAEIAAQAARLGVTID
jgi:hypothetical protein